ncbi:unnamed protein product [Caenorhabditis bovis]|uniref:Palmitoyltransferase n=1 Tax=Caenorhabditis bovis TaxID=2654633 RepID=A0A8S1EHU8_9PELO|nr:unnamed protein product [Caenorhabditis bovis]
MNESPSEPQTHQRQQLNDIHSVITACQHGRPAIVEEALRQGVSANAADEDGCSLLHWAAINNRIEVVKLLLSYNADPNVLGGVLVSSPLHWAARNGHVAVCALLVKAGAVCNVRDAQGYTPMHLAIQGSHVPLVAYFLLKFDYARDITDNSGMTPAMWCAYRSFTMFPLRLIVRSGADLTLKEHLMGNTALHIAAQERNHSAVIELLEAGASVAIRNKQQETPLDIARNNKNPRILDAIEEAARRQRVVRTSFVQNLFVPPISTYFYFFGPTIIFLLMWQLFTHVPVFFATVIALIFCITAMVTLRFDFHDPTYKLLPIGVTVSEALVMMISWATYAHWYVPWWAQLLFVIAYLSLVFSFVRILRMDPGVARPAKDCHEMYVREAEAGIQYQEKYCFSCFIRKLEHTKHCAVCNHCVNKFDHHCPWLHSCITRKNMREFILFIISVAASSAIYFFATTHFALIEISEHGTEKFIETHAFLIVTIFLSAMHGVMLTVLFFVQINQISMNVTTHDRIKANRSHSHTERNKHDRHSIIHQPITISQRCHNLLEFCSSNGDPSW